MKAKLRSGSRKPLATDPRALEVQAKFLEALALHQKGRLDEAQSLYKEVLRVQPRHFESLHFLGVVAYQKRSPDVAIRLISEAINVNPNAAAAYSNLGLALQEVKRHDEALASYDKALSLRPSYAEVLNNRGNVLQKLSRPDDALVNYEMALVHKPDYSEAHFNRGNVLKDLKRMDEALVSYDKALALNPTSADACYNRGLVLMGLGRINDALASYEQALALKPDHAEALNNRGNVLSELKRLDEALVSYNAALALKPHFAEALNNRGNVLKALQRLHEALASYDSALALKPDYAEALHNRATVLMEFDRLHEALAGYDQAIALKPGYAEAYYSRGEVLNELHRLDEALASYNTAYALDATIPLLFSTLLHTRMALCEWEGLSQSLAHFEMAVKERSRVVLPFVALGLLDSPGLHRHVSTLFSQNKHPKSDALGPIGKRLGKAKIRVGYFSADFHNHATSYLTAELFEAHNAEKFELYGFSFGPHTEDNMRKRIASSFHEFIDARKLTSREIAARARTLGIDIAIDLKGYTKDARTDIFAERCAPIQVNYLGYPGTMGCDYMDYVIADRIVIPEERQSDYSEQVVYLPHSYQVNDSKKWISDRVFCKSDFGLPDSGFVFCCFNNNFKILPSTFDGWMRILKAVEGSVLWLLEDQSTARKNLIRAAEARGIAGSRLVFARRMPLDEHLARHRLADLFIDTLPYNAHTTASDALWAGLPVLTCTGQSFASRVAASLIDAIGLPELIARSQPEYEAKAIELANDAQRLREIRSNLARNRLTSPLFDARLFARHIESAYEAMYARHLAGLPPASISVPS